MLYENVIIQANIKLKEPIISSMCRLDNLNNILEEIHSDWVYFATTIEAENERQDFLIKYGYSIVKDLIEDSANQPVCTWNSFYIKLINIIDQHSSKHNLDGYELLKLLDCRWS